MNCDLWRKSTDFKGQIISKGLFGVLEFSQKTNERFLGEFEDTKSPFEIILPLHNIKGPSYKGPVYHSSTLFFLDTRHKC